MHPAEYTDEMRDRAAAATIIRNARQAIAHSAIHGSANLTYEDATICYERGNYKRAIELAAEAIRIAKRDAKLREARRCP